MEFTLSAIDWLWVAIYFVAVYSIALWASRGQRSSTDYFLAGRGVPWVVIGASLFATNIGTEHLVGLSADGFKGGMAVGHYEWMASLIILLLGWLFVPFYLSSGVVTMPEFLERRYNAPCRYYLSVISIIGYVLTKISVILFAGSLILEQMIGLNFWVSCVAMIVLTGLYTLLGGLKAVLYTDFIQAIVLVGGAILLTVLGLKQVGGIGVLKETVPDDFFSMFKPVTHGDFPWTGIVFGAPILGVWYWCTDQFIVQRVLSARGIQQAQRATILAGYLKILPVFLMVLPGMIGYVLVQQGAFQIDMPNQIYPALVATVLPSGLKGVVLAGLLAALMSSLSSTFNSCSTLVTFDLYKRLRPDASDRSLVNVGRAAVGVLMLVGLLCVALIDPETPLFQYLQKVQAYIAPPIAAVFFCGLVFRRLNGPGAFAALMTGFVLGSLRLGLESGAAADSNGAGAVHFLLTTHFLHFAAILFWICLAVLFAVSFATKPPASSQVTGLTLSGRNFDHHVNGTNLVCSLILVAAVIGLWVIFF